MIPKLWGWSSISCRDGRRLTLTAAGEVLAAAGAEAIDVMAAARSAVDDFEAASGGTVTISGFHSVGQTLFGPLIRELGASATAPTVQLTDEDVAQSEFPALTARYDLVLAHRMEHSAPWPRHGIRCLTLVWEPLDVAVAATHPLASRKTLSPGDVADQPWGTSRIGYSPDDVLRAVAAVANRDVRIPGTASTTTAPSRPSWRRAGPSACCRDTRHAASTRAISCACPCAGSALTG